MGGIGAQVGGSPRGPEARGGQIHSHICLQEWDLYPYPAQVGLTAPPPLPAQALSLTTALAAELPGLTRNSRRDRLAKRVSRAREKIKP